MSPSPLWYCPTHSCRMNLTPPCAARAGEGVLRLVVPVLRLPRLLNPLCTVLELGARKGQGGLSRICGAQSRQVSCKQVPLTPGQQHSLLPHIHVLTPNPAPRLPTMPPQLLTCSPIATCCPQPWAQMTPAPFSKVPPDKQDSVTLPPIPTQAPACC